MWLLRHAFLEHFLSGSWALKNKDKLEIEEKRKGNVKYHEGVCTYPVCDE